MEVCHPIALAFNGFSRKKLGSASFPSGTIGKEKCIWALGDRVSFQFPWWAVGFLSLFVQSPESERLKSDSAAGDWNLSYHSR